MTTAAKKTAAKTTKADEATTKIVDSAREYVARSAASAKERTDDAYEGVTKFNNGLEKTMNRLVVGYVGILGDIAEATHANVKHALETVEKVAAAKTFTEAAQVQVDFVRESTTANYDRARTAFDATRDVVSEGVKTIRESASDLMPQAKKAA
ncbi:MAG: phasin family protein [Pseudomonadota bacterium]